MRKSITLIELVVAILVLSLAFPALYKFFSDAVRLSLDSESASTATQIAQSFMEEMHLKCFDEDPASLSDVLGPDQLTCGLDGTLNENSSDHANWDDADDYNGYDQDYENDGSYHVNIQVFYVSGDNLETEVTTLKTNYKRIKIEVFKKPDLDDPAAVLDSLVTASSML